MATMAFIIMTEAEKDQVEELNEPGGEYNLDGQLITNPLANNLGEGVLVGKYVIPARILNDPGYARFYDLCLTFPIRTMDSDVLFTPPSGDI